MDKHSIRGSPSDKLMYSERTKRMDQTHSRWHHVNDIHTRDEDFNHLSNRNNKDGPSYLILRKHEWNRLKKQSSPPEEPSNEQKEYIKSLIDQSQEWTKTWPDTAIGCAVSHEKAKERQRKADLATVKAFANKKKNYDNSEVIREARKKIFDNSCYGKKLLSAFHESKTLEERDAQVLFLNELKMKETLKNKQIIEDYPFGMDKHEAEEDKLRKHREIEIALQNKAIYETQKVEALKTKAAENKADLENAQLMRELLDREQEAEDRVRLLEKEALDQFSVEHKKSKEERAKWEAEYNTRIEKCRKEKEELNCKINHIIQKMHKRDDLPWAKKLYDTIQVCQEKNSKRYDVLLENSIKLEEYRSAEEKKKSKEKEKQVLEKNRELAKTNKVLAEQERQQRCNKVNKCYCDRQTLFLKGHKDRLKQEVIDIDTEEKRGPYFPPSNKLISALKKRMEQPSPWTGGKASHEQFAREADKTLRECKYKHPGRKVVDEYMKVNGLLTLDVPNYH